MADDAWNGILEFKQINVELSNQKDEELKQNSQLIKNKFESIFRTSRSIRSERLAPQCGKINKKENSLVLIKLKNAQLFFQIIALLDQKDLQERTEKLGVCRDFNSKI